MSIQSEQNFSQKEKWSPEQGVAYEAAQELLNKVHALMLERIRISPNDNYIKSEISKIQGLILHLDPVNSEHIQQVREEYRLLFQILAKDL